MSIEIMLTKDQIEMLSRGEDVEVVVTEIIEIGGREHEIEIPVWIGRKYEVVK